MNSPKMKLPLQNLVSLLCLALALPVSAQERVFPTAQEIERKFGAEVEYHFDQPYASNTNQKQMLDLFLPKNRTTDQPLPVIVFIHGGGWKGGDRKRAAALVAEHARSGNYAGVTINYRLSDEAKWPAQIHDCKAAIRWIRGHAKEFNLDPNRIGVQGGSAGGHLATLVGLSGDSQELEGDVGDFKGLSSRVACIVNYCGPSDLTQPLMQGEAALSDDPAVTGLLGSSLQEGLNAAKAASPINYVTADDPPLLIVHGTKDQRVDFQHALRLDAAMKKAQASSILIAVTDGGHGIQGGVELSNRVMQFFDLKLRGVPTEISAAPVPNQPPPEK